MRRWSWERGGVGEGSRETQGLPLPLLIVWILNPLISGILHFVICQMVTEVPLDEWEDQVSSVPKHSQRHCGAPAHSARHGRISLCSLLVLLKGCSGVVRPPVVAQAAIQALAPSTMGPGE